MPVTIGALREVAPSETRVSLTPEVAEKLAQTGARVLIEPGAGIRARFPDALYKKVEWAANGQAVLADQMQYLIAHFPRSSPLHDRIQRWLS
jgi:NAD(P) transhydrogenase subunit alpha